MKKLKNWDNQTWLSSKNYINQFNKFLNKRVRFNKNTKILDIVKNKGIKKNIIFKKIDGYDYLKRNKEKYDLILLKQTIHFFS